MEAPRGYHSEQAHKSDAFHGIHHLEQVLLKMRRVQGPTPKLGEELGDAYRIRHLEHGLVWFY
jgi:hypothetical protein